MAALHSALTALGREEFSNVPTADNDLSGYMSELFNKAETIIESIPQPPATEDGTKSPTARVDGLPASNASEISLSSSRSALPSAGNEELQKQWGKPLKLKASENPLGITVYKAAGKDGKGAWFARRSVHEGLSFSRWQKALADEFPESMEAGTNPGEGNIRGIGGERRVEDKRIEGIGHLEVFQLSAQFPGPTTPRDFITLLITSGTALKGNKNNVPRHYMIISKPCVHEECPPRSGYIRGQYESVEMIREVPRKSTPDSSGTESEGEGQDSNPVEWIMVTRSDPGGSVPKFMVERGTPSSICGDAVKFLDWATKQNQEEETLTRRRSLPSWETNGHMAGVEGSTKDTEPEPDAAAPTGFLASATGAFHQGLDSYAPQALLDVLPGRSTMSTTPSPNPQISSDNDDDDAQSTISSASFASAESHNSSMSPSIDSGAMPPSTSSKELNKITQRRATLDTKLASARERAFKSTATDTPPTNNKEVEAQKRQTEKAERDLKKEEERYQKEVAKLDAKTAKEVKKLEDKKKKEEEKEEGRKKKEIEKDINKQLTDARKEADLLKKERDVLVKLVGDLQGENTRLSVRLAEHEGTAMPKSASQTSLGLTSTAPGIAAGAGAAGGARSRSASARSSTTKASNGTDVNIQDVLRDAAERTGHHVDYSHAHSLSNHDELGKEVRDVTRLRGASEASKNASRSRGSLGSKGSE